MFFTAATKQGGGALAVLGCLKSELEIGERTSAVVPAKAGTQMPWPIDYLRRMGPGPRFRSAGTTAKS
jgi:hypothetical protein